MVKMIKQGSESYLTEFLQEQEEICGHQELHFRQRHFTQRWNGGGHLLHHVSDVILGQQCLRGLQPFFSLREGQNDVQTVLPCQREFPHLQPETYSTSVCVC